MRPFIFPLALLLIAAAPPKEMASWRAQAANVVVTRDDFGIAHVSGPTDADAVFGMVYAQAEDDFPRIEANYLTALGRTAEADGEKAIWLDLRARLYVSDEELKAQYAASPDWLKRLMDSWAAGLNYYLATHPAAKPRVLTRFEPWMALSFTEGSIGGDIERIDLGQLKDFYSGRRLGDAGQPYTPGQESNGIAIAPSLTRDGKALLLINPHTSFFFRSEQQVSSGQGLNAYGAATWGQFFIYQGFNDRAGWMHTSSGVDSVDEFAVEVRKGNPPAYRFGTIWRPLTARPVTIRYRTEDGKLASRRFTTWRTHRGPIIRSENDRWVAFAMMNRPIEALQQSFLRTKAADLASFMKVAQLRANSSNNTIFADSKGEIAYLHPQYVPRRNDRFDYTRPVDGSDPATDWGSVHGLTDLPSVINPPNGWVQNTNAWPYRAAGPFSPNPAFSPKYMDSDGENFRGFHAVKLLSGSRGWTLEKLQAAAYDNDQPGFAEIVPALVKAFDGLPATDPLRSRIAPPLATLRSWDYRWSADSIAQTLAMAWGEALKRALNAPKSEPGNKVMMRLSRDTSPELKLRIFDETIAYLKRDFGRWNVPWGEVNRFQRISPAISPPYSDAEPSIPVPFTEGRWGSLASFRSEPRAGTKRWYGNYGNSFVAVVEFGPRVRAHAVTAGGESGDPALPHFNDQAGRYAAGDLRPVYFYSDELKGHIERTYRPGE